MGLSLHVSTGSLRNSIMAADLLFAVGAEPKLFAPDLSFDPLNMSDPRWEEVMPSKSIVFPATANYCLRELIVSVN